MLDFKKYVILLVRYMENKINIGDQNTQQIGQNQDSEPVQISEKTKVNYLVIGITILLCLIVFGFGGYFLGKRTTNDYQNLGGGLNQPTPYSSPTTQTQPSPTQPATYTSPSPAILTWKTESVQIKKETTVSGSENINLSIQLPSNWILKTVSKATSPNNMIKNCADYVITSVDSTVRLTISPICSGWSAEYSDWPQSAVTIKEEKNQGVDGHTAYTVRYLDTTTNQYKYVEGEKGTSNKIMDAILITYNSSTGNFLPTRVVLDYSGTDSESTLKITDKIVTSLKAQ